jgi:hypothetical protein
MVGFMSDAGMVRPYTAPQLRFELIEAPSPPSGWRAIEDFESARELAFAFEGGAFSGRSVPSIHGKLPAVGPIGGARYLSSAASSRGLRGKGEATSDPFRLPLRDGLLHLRAGITGDGSGCRLALVDERGKVHEFPVPRSDWGLATIDWPIGPRWAGRRVRLVVTDDDPEAAIFVDEVYVEGEG